MKTKLRTGIAFVFMLAVCMAAGLFGTTDKTYAASSSNYDDTVVIDAECDYDLAEEALEEMNEIREERGLDPLVMDEELQDYAMQRAAEATIYCWHIRPDGSSSLTGKVYSEDLGTGWTLGSAVVEMWMEDEHAIPIISSASVSVGLGCVKVGNAYYWAAVFSKEDAETEADATGTQTNTYSINVDYDVVAIDEYSFFSGCDYETRTLLVGETYQLQALTRTFFFNEEENYSYAGSGSNYAYWSASGLTWKSSNTSVVKVSSQGVVTAVGSGTATVTATSPGGITWTQKFKVSSTFELTSDSTDIELSKTSYTYDGTSKKPSVTVYRAMDDELKTLIKDEDYTVTYKNNKNAGTASVVITGIGQYTGSVTVNFTIKSKSIASDSAAASVSLSKTSYTYNGSARKPSTTVKITLNGSSKTLTKGTDYTVSYSNNKNAGTATVKITGTGNYSGTLKKTFKITKKDISSGTATLSYTSKSYTGSALKPSVTMKISLNGSTKTLTKDTDYTVTYKNNQSIGKATVTIKGTGNYKGTITKTFTIGPKVSIKSVTNSTAKKLTVKWAKTSSASGYQIRYKVYGSSTWTTKTVSSSTLSKTLTGLKSGKIYYIQVRAYKTVSGTKCYGSWSTAITTCK